MYKINLIRILYLLLNINLIINIGITAYANENKYCNTMYCDKNGFDKFNIERWNDIWTWIKGQSSKDAILLGMWSLHLDGSGDLFGDGKNNDYNHLFGVQYKGFNIGTFINSHNNRTYSAGLSRVVFTSHHDHDIRYDIGYKIGMLYGYGDNLRNIWGISGYAMPVLSFTWKRIGFDVGIVPVGVLTLNFRYDF